MASNNPIFNRGDAGRLRGSIRVEAFLFTLLGGVDWMFGDWIHSMAGSTGPALAGLQRSIVAGSDGVLYGDTHPLKHHFRLEAGRPPVPLHGIRGGGGIHGADGLGGLAREKGGERERTHSFVMVLMTKTKYLG